MKLRTRVEISLGDLTSWLHTAHGILASGEPKVFVVADGREVQITISKDRPLILELTEEE